MNRFKVSLHNGGDVFFCSFLKVGEQDSYGNTEYHFSVQPENLEHTWAIKGDDQRGEILSRMAPGTPFTISLKDTGKKFPYATIITDKAAPTAPHPASAPQPVAPPVAQAPIQSTAHQKGEPDWEKIARGKTKCAISEAFISGGSKKITPAIKADIIEFVDFIMSDE